MSATGPGKGAVLAARVVQGLLRDDRVSEALGMRVVSADEGNACVEMEVRGDMLNGHSTCHGGIVFVLADSAFAFACNSRNIRNVAAGAQIDYLRPAFAGDVLRAQAKELSSGRRLGLYDVKVMNQRGETVALFRGKSCRVEGVVVEAEETEVQGSGSNEGSCDGVDADGGVGLEAIETASRDELQALQLERLRWTLHHAYVNVPHYRRAFDTAGVHPDDLLELADLRRFPFTLKGDVRDNYPFGMFAVPREQIRRIHASSGTTGKPTVVGYTDRDLDTWANLVARSIRAAGGRQGDMIHIAYGYGLFTGGLGAHYGAERAGCTVIPMSGGQTEKQVQLICDLKPDIIMVTPSYMLNIVDEFEKQGLDASAFSLRIGIFGAEPWTNAMRGQLERSAGLDAMDIYGLSEVMGPGVASECVETKDGPVVWEDHFYPEIIDPQTGEVLPDGSEGELVFTSLTKEAMPVIRYRTRDLTRLLPPTSRSMRRIDKITGRSDDMLIIRGVNVFPTQIEELMLKCAELSGHYLIEVFRQGNLDELKVTAELTCHAEGTMSSERREELARRPQDQVKDHIGISVCVVPAAPFTLARSAGKACHVIDTRNKTV